jgi:hypothetical protein
MSHHIAPSSWHPGSGGSESGPIRVRADADSRSCAGRGVSRPLDRGIVVENRLRSRTYLYPAAMDLGRFASVRVRGPASPTWPARQAAIAAKIPPTKLGEQGSTFVRQVSPSREPNSDQSHAKQCRCRPGAARTRRRPRTGPGHEGCRGQATMGILPVRDDESTLGEYT